MAKKHIPVEHAEAIYLHGQIDYNTRLMSFLNDHGVAVHVFGWNDRYAGSLMPERGQTSGRTVVEQVRAYDDPEQRQSSLPRSSVEYPQHADERHVLRQSGVRARGRNRGVDNATARIDDAGDISELMGVEATARRAYYQTFEAVLPDSFAFDGREYNPPPNPVNALISFGNSMVYANCVSAIRATALDPTISYLHEPGERRYFPFAGYCRPVQTSANGSAAVQTGQP